MLTSQACMSNNYLSAACDLIHSLPGDQAPLLPSAASAPTQTVRECARGTSLLVGLVSGPLFFFGWVTLSSVYFLRGDSEYKLVLLLCVLSSCACTGHEPRDQRTFGGLCSESHSPPGEPVQNLLFFLWT